MLRENQWLDLDYDVNDARDDFEAAKVELEEAKEYYDHSERRVEEAREGKTEGITLGTWEEQWEEAQMVYKRAVANVSECKKSLITALQNYGDALVEHCPL